MHGLYMHGEVDGYTRAAQTPTQTLMVMYPIN